MIDRFLMILNFNKQKKDKHLLSLTFDEIFIIDSL